MSINEAKRMDENRGSEGDAELYFGVSVFFLDRVVLGTEYAVYYYTLILVHLGCILMCIRRCIL